MKFATRYATTVIVLTLFGFLTPVEPATANEQSPASAETALPHPAELWPMPEDNGYDDFLAAIELLPEPPDYQGPGAKTMLAEGLDSYSDAELRQFLSAHHLALNKLRKALNKPFVVSYQWLFEGRSWEALFPYLSEAQQLVRVLAVDSAYHLDGGRHHQAWSNLRATLTLGNNVCRGGTLEHWVVSQGIQQNALKTCKEWIARDPPADILLQANQFLKHLHGRQVPTWKKVAMGVWDTRQALKGLYQEHWSTEKSQETNERNPGVVALLNMDSNTVLQAWEQYAVGLIEIAKMPFFTVSEKQIIATVEGSDWPPSVAARWLPRLLNKEAVMQTQLRGTEIMAALELYRYNQPHQGRYPATLQDLVPEYLPEVPKDPFTGQDLLYRRTGRFTYKLYSAGPNKLDDGGAHKGDVWHPDDADVVVYEVK